MKRDNDGRLVLLVGNVRATCSSRASDESCAKSLILGSCVGALTLRLTTFDDRTLLDEGFCILGNGLAAAEFGQGGDAIIEMD